MPGTLKNNCDKFIVSLYNMFFTLKNIFTSYPICNLVIIPAINEKDFFWEPLYNYVMKRVPVRRSHFTHVWGWQVTLWLSICVPLVTTSFYITVATADQLSMPGWINTVDDCYLMSTYYVSYCVLGGLETFPISFKYLVCFSSKYARKWKLGEVK